MNKIKSYIENLRHTIMVASLNFDVHRVLTSDQTRPLYVDIMNSYSDFFATSIHAHFVAMIVALYRFYEKRKDTYNIPSLLILLKKQNDFPVAKLMELEKIYNEQALPISKKICLLRNNCFAHLSKNSTAKDFFKKAKLKPKEVRLLINLSKEMLNTISHITDKSRYAFNSISPSDIVCLLDDLKEYQKVRMHNNK
jgi:hypothetical protein